MAEADKPEENIEIEERAVVAGRDIASLEALTSAAASEEQHLELVYGAKHVIMLFVPVSLCMLVVITTIHSVSFFSLDDGNYLVYTPFHPEEDDTGGRTLVKSVLNSLIILGVVIFMTFGLILLYKLRCYYVIHGWIILSSVMLLFMFGFVYLQELLKAYNIPMDIFSTVFCLFNFGITGMFAIHWKGPLVLQQAYLILSASLMSLIFIRYMPEWTLWLVLALLAIWDLVAVLAPHGPLKMLVETAHERGEQVMPALIYSSTVLYPIISMAKPNNSKQRRSSKADKRKDQSKPPEESNVTDPGEVNAEIRGSEGGSEGTDENDAERELRRASERIAQLEQDIEEVEEKGVKLGLGDFIFYSVLVGKASASREPTTTIACFIGILMGLFLTLAILVTVKKALPALPISILFGISFNFGTNYLIAPMVQEMAANQIFV